MKKEIYSCDVCRQDKPPHELFGVPAVNHNEFKLVEYRHNDWKNCGERYICKLCVKMIKDAQL